jgi:hypothetical protein
MVRPALIGGFKLWFHKNLPIMNISDEKKLRDVKEEFHRKFSHLKIEFYEGVHTKGKGSHHSEQLDAELTLGSVGHAEGSGAFFIDPQMAVADFEQNIKEKYGLNVQVFRKSGNLWIQTTATDSWTLAEQNRKGGASEEAYQERQESAIEPHDLDQD